MMGLDEIGRDLNLVNAIDWEMGPEDAVTMYLEWGNNPALGNRRVRSKNDCSTYFVVNTWKEKPRIFLIRRNSESAEELAAFEMPAAVEGRFLDSVGHNKGVYALSAEVKQWLKSRLHVPHH